MSLSSEFGSNPVAFVADDPRSNTNRDDHENDDHENDDYENDDHENNDHENDHLSGSAMLINNSSIADDQTTNPTTPGTPSDNGSSGDAVDMTSDRQDAPHSLYVTACLSPTDLFHDETAPDAPAKLLADADANCKWDMSLFNFSTALRNKNVRRFPWLETPSFAWRMVLRVLNGRYPPKPFYPKDPRVSRHIWTIIVVQKNRASCTRIIGNVAAIYAKAQRRRAQERSEDDELIVLMNNISVRDTDQTPKLPWISKEDPSWVGILMAFDILFATNPCSNINNAELRMNYMRVSRYAVGLVRREKPWLAPDQEPHQTTPLQAFSALSAALSSPLSGVESGLPGNGIKRKREIISKDEDGQEHGAEADIENDDGADNETDDEDVPSVNSRLKCARID